MILEREELNKGKNTSEGVSHEVEKVLDQNQIAVDIQDDLPMDCLEISLHNATKDNSSNKAVSAGKQPEKETAVDCACERETQAISTEGLKETAGGLHPLLDLSVAPTGMILIIITQT